MPPRFVSCPICMQQFGSASIEIHVPQCYQKNLKRWEQTAPKDRGPRPQMPPPSAYGGRGGGPSFASNVPQSTLAAAAGGGLMAARGFVSPADGMTVRSVSGRPGDVTQPPPAPTYSSLAKCRFCGRSFAPDRVMKHQSVCANAKGPRKAFNSRGQRLRDLDGADLAPARGGRQTLRATSHAVAAGGGGGARSFGRTGPPRSDWRRQHEEFIAAIRDARRHAPPPRAQPAARGPQVHHPVASQPFGSRRFYGASGGATPRGSRATNSGLGGPVRSAGGFGGGGGGFESFSAAPQRSVGRGGAASSRGAEAANYGRPSVPAGAGILPTNDTSPGMLEALGRSNARPFPAPGRASQPSASSAFGGPPPRPSSYSDATYGRGVPPAQQQQQQQRPAPSQAPLPPSAGGRIRRSNESSSEMLGAFGWGR